MKQLLWKVFQIKKKKKKSLMDRGYPHNIKENLLSQTNLKERKEEKDTIPALSVSSIQESLM